MIEASNKLDQILMDCIQAIEEKGWTIEDCLRRYPHLRQDLGPMLEAAIRLKDVRSVEPSRRFKRETLGRMQLRLQASRRPPKTASFHRRTTSEGVLPRARVRPQKRSGLQWALPILVGAFVFISMVGGFTYAADAANPGDALYQVDKVIEQVQIRLTTSTEGKTKLFLDFASERIDEAFALLEKGRSDQVIVALQGYEESIHAAETILKDIAGKEEYPHLVTLLNETLERQTGKLHNLMAVAPETVQSLILAAILKIDNLRMAMAMPSPTATATPQADETPVSPEPTDTGIASATSPPSTTPVADGTPIPSSTPVASSTPAASLTPISPTATNPTAVASPTVPASSTPTPTYPPVTTSPSPTPTPTPSPAPSNTPIPGPDLTVSTYQWIPSLPAGSEEILDYLVRNIGTTTAQGGYRVQLYVDDTPLQNIDPEIGVRQGRLLLAGETDIDYFIWLTSCGVHHLYIVVDDTNIIQESNESNNSTDVYTIIVDCPTATPP